MTVAPPAVPFP